MDLKQLKALVTVAEAGSVTKASQLLHLVQPAVTRQIKTLEQELGVPLFERTREGMRPTVAGAALVERARRALNELDRARAEIRRDPGPVTGIATVGLLESTLDVLVEPLVEQVAKHHPGIQLRLLTAYSGHLQQWLDDGDVDLSLLYNLRSTPSLHVQPLLREQLWVVAPPSAGLCVERPVPLKDLVARPLVMPGPGHGLRVLVDQACARAKASPHISIETNSMRLQKKLVLAGHGWTILPASGVSADVAAGQFSAAPLADPEATRDLVLGTPRTGRPAPAVDVVARELVRIVGSLVADGKWPSARLFETSPVS
ncbi:LysR substrate-binding domain-containing protein [Antrihabitans stalactiti]|uniref:LysR family transcriptional regulator n=1 Tax=Antrihabitans stalactiti TaxID=2584121 RepID=A0A848K569_9NOCA|nr:LysR substrate-binding domain-containing protein [Antrihabitans stalactiti]NMN93873.1 LysR family transcriptional regulator [Antrihabitans stalactiti]